ncbi:hypothetical protein COHCIP112018_02586 [Cohnella sp. JJ-181]|nr:hypothetical protein COHCIP112018_02586 [Cohnella sp. JJ-181]
MLTSNGDLLMNRNLTQASREAIKQAIDSADIASKAVLEANELDFQVTQAFNSCNEVATQLAEAINRVEATL